MEWFDYLTLYSEILILLFVANGAPILTKKLLGTRFDFPLDAHQHLADGRPLFGKSKTVRGVLAALLITPPFALFLGYEWWLGLGVALTAMMGDLISSFLKRRLAKEASSMMLGVDQIPESLLPLLFLATQLPLSVFDLILLVILFFVLELLISKVLYRLHIRSRPY